MAVQFFQLDADMRILDNNTGNSQEVLVLGLLESEIFKGDIRPNLCVCLFVCVCVWTFVKLGLCTKRQMYSG